MSFQDLTFSTRTQDGVPRENQRDEKENVWQVDKSQRSSNAFYEVAPRTHFFHQDPGWDPKGQPKEQHEKRMTGMKTLATFYWIS